MPNDPRTTVLVVDDDVEFVSDFAVALNACGYRVLEAPNAESAYAAMDSGKRVDVVVVDLVLPDKSGLEVLHQTRQRHPEVKLLAMTDLEDNLHLQVAKHMGADAAVRKFPASDIGDFPDEEWIAEITRLLQN